MKIKEFHEPVKPDTYEASMALNQLLKIGNHAVKLHKLIKDEAEMEAWVQKKIDLAGDYVKKVHGYMGGEKAGLYDSKMFETYVRVKKDAEGEISQFAGRLGRVVDQDDDGDYLVSWGDNEGEDWIEKKNLEFLPDDAYWNPDDEDYYKKGSKGDRYINDPDTAGEVPTLDPEFEEDAGEGHMSKSTLYHTAKYAIELASMINPGDDLEGWVQSKLNKAADYLQGAYNYEEYQKLNPYREELDSNTLSKHAQVVQKHIDEILARETKLDDIDTKPGMMRILSKRVNEVEKEMAKENRKEVDEAPIEQDRDNPIAKPYVDTPEWKALHDMDDKIIDAYIKHKEVKENKIRLSTDPHDFGAYGTDTYKATGPITNIPVNQLVGFEPEDKMRSPKSMAKVNAIANAIKNKQSIPPVLARKYKNGYQVIDGHHRFWGSRKAGVNFVKAQIVPPEDIEEVAPPGREKQVKALKKKFKDKSAPYAIAWAQHNKHGKPKNEAELEEGLKDWAKSLAMAGIFVAGLAGVGSINDAINNSVPAIKAMNNALEMAKERGDDNLVAQIEKDLKGAKLRLDIGRDLNQVKYLQDKYSKFMPTEGLAYESKLAILLNQRLK